MSPSLALASAERNEPGPPSLVLVTMTVTESYSSALLTATLPLCPPATSTLPLGSNVAV